MDMMDSMNGGSGGGRRFRDSQNDGNHQVPELVVACYLNFDEIVACDVEDLDEITACDVDDFKLVTQMEA